MDLSNRFQVEATPESTWGLLMDVPRVVPCMPGAQLVEAVAEDRWKVEMRTKLGPMSMVFDAEVARSAVDAENRVLTLDVSARERRGRGQAKARISSGLRPLGPERTEVDVQTALSLSGRIGQFGRGAVQDVAAEMTERFTANLREVLNESADGPLLDLNADGPVPDPQAAIAAWPVLLGAVRRRVARIFARLRGRRDRAERPG